MAYSWSTFWKGLVESVDQLASAFGLGGYMSMIWDGIDKGRDSDPDELRRKAINTVTDRVTKALSKARELQDDPRAAKAFERYEELMDQASMAFPAAVGAAKAKVQSAIRRIQREARAEKKKAEDIQTENARKQAQLIDTANQYQQLADTYIQDFDVLPRAGKMWDSSKKKLNEAVDNTLADDLDRLTKGE